jgi:hypothetical protein
MNIKISSYFFKDIYIYSNHCFILLLFFLNYLVLQFGEIFASLIVLAFQVFVTVCSFLYLIPIWFDNIVFLPKQHEMFHLFIFNMQGNLFQLAREWGMGAGRTITINIQHAI